MTTTPPEDDIKKARLERLLNGLAQSYNERQVPQGALERLKAKFNDQNRLLSDQELDWLAAAGGPFVPETDDDDDDDVK